MVLGEPDVAEAERLGGLGDLDAPRVDLLRGARRRRLHQQERSEIDRHRRTRYQGCGWPGVLTRNAYTDVRAVRNRVRRSWPPNARLTGTSGVRMIPSCVPYGAHAQLPPVAVQP